MTENATESSALDTSTIFSTSRPTRLKDIDSCGDRGTSDLAIPYRIYEFTHRVAQNKNELLVLSGLVRFVFEGGRSSCEIETSALAKWAGIPPSSVSRSVNRLAEGGLVRKRPGQTGKGFNFYELPFVQEYLDGEVREAHSSGQDLGEAVSSLVGHQGDARRARGMVKQAEWNLSRLIESYSLKQMAHQKEVEITQLKNALEADLDDDVPSGRALEILKLLIEQRNRLKEAIAVIDLQIDQPFGQLEPAVESVQPIADRFDLNLKRWVKAKWKFVSAIFMVVIAVGVSVDLSRTIGKHTNEGSGLKNTAPILQTTVSSSRVKIQKLFDDQELSREGKRQLKDLAIEFARSLQKISPKTGQGPLKFLITTHSSPSYGERFANPADTSSTGYQYNLRVSEMRAKQIKDYLFGREIGNYPGKAELSRIAEARGVSYSHPLLPSPGASVSGTCGPYDCSSSRRVEFQLMQ